MKVFLVRYDTETYCENETTCSSGVREVCLNMDSALRCVDEALEGSKWEVQRCHRGRSWEVDTSNNFCERTTTYYIEEREVFE